jgi:anti-anti-sigma factor
MSALPQLRLADRGTVPVAHIAGELDVASAGTVKERLLQAVENQDVGMVVDLSDATYVDSAGLNLLFDLAERLAVRQMEFAVVYPEGGIVERVLVLVDIASVAEVHHSVDAAVRAILGKRGSHG